MGMQHTDPRPGAAVQRQPHPPDETLRVLVAGAVQCGGDSACTTGLAFAHV